MDKDPTEHVFDDRWGDMPYTPGEPGSRGVGFGQSRNDIEYEPELAKPPEVPTFGQEEGLGRKFDQDKPRWDLLPWRETQEIVEILTFGSKKYEDNNWQHVKGAKWRYFGAMFRHVIAWWCGEKKDPESGKSHLAHAGCCLLFLMWFDNKEN